MSDKDGGIDDKELELETWPAFVDILSSTVVALAFAFFILVVLLSISKITTASESEGKKDKKSGGTSEIQNAVLAKNAATYPKVTIVSPSIMARNQQTKTQTSEKKDNRIIMVPEQAKVSPKQVKVHEPGDSYQEVLGEIPKFTDSRVMEVLKEMVIVQQDVITQQRRVIEQQDTKIEQTTREYQSLLSVITKNPEVETLHQKSNPKKDLAKFIPIDKTGPILSGIRKTPHGHSVYTLSPPNTAFKGVEVQTRGLPEGSMRLNFKDNANYMTPEVLAKVKEDLRSHISGFASRGVVIYTRPSDFSISASEGKRVAVDRMILVRSILIEMGVNKKSIKFKPFVSQSTSGKDQNSQEQDNYGWVQIDPNN